MSFSSDIKREIAKNLPEKDCCVIAELNALTQCLGSLSLQGRGQVQLKFKSDNPVVARRLLVLLRQYCRVQVSTDVKKLPRFGGRFVTTLTLSLEDSHRLLRRLNVLKQDAGGQDVFQGVPRRIVRRICCRRAFLCGMFLGAGSVTAPEKDYHAEFVVGDEARARFLMRVLELSGIPASLTMRRGQAVVYLKDSEMIARLLATMSAARAMLRLEDVRTVGAVKQQVTRALNCDQANLNKQVSAAQRQLEAISRISHLVGLRSLPQPLEELARLRLSNQEASLEELGQKLSPPVTKSGIQHRMRKLLQMADSVTDRAPTTYQEEVTP